MQKAAYSWCISSEWPNFRGLPNKVMELAQTTAVNAFNPLFMPEEEKASQPCPRLVDREGFYDLIRPHERNLYLTVFAVTGNHADAEEVVQETVLKAYLHLDQFRGDARFSTWLMRIAVNEARGLLRKYRRAKWEPLEQTLPSGKVLRRDFPDPRETPAESLEREEVRATIGKVVEMLPPKYQEIFVLRDLKRLSISDTARRLGITRSTVKARLWRARIKMRRLISARLEHRSRRDLSPKHRSSKSTSPGRPKQRFEHAD